MKISLQLSNDIETLLTTFKDSPKKNQVAIDRALRKLSRWTERKLLRDLSGQLKITQKLLKEFKRVKVTLYKAIGQSESTLVVWMGTYDIGAHKLGKPVQTKSGVRTGKHTWDGAFLMQPLNAPYPSRI